ncbi:MAG: hypothetical protein WKF40_11990 [Thermoleophilaceae bacterium]
MRIWDPGSGAVERVLEGHTDWVNAVCAVRVDGRDLLASAAADRTVRIWDPGSGAVERVLEGHTGWVTRGVRGAGRRPGPARLRRRTTARCGSGTRTAARSSGSWKATPTG